MLWINPTAAALMLSEYLDLKPGDWVIQNASNSGVGRAVIAFGKARGLRLINLVRRQDDVAEVEAAGGEVVLVDDERALDQITKAVGDGRVRLALDGVGGAATARLASALSQHGELVGYAYMGDYAAPGDFRPLMNKDITLHSFYEGRSQYDVKIPGILREATAMIAAGTLHFPVARDISALRIQRGDRPRRTRRQGASSPTEGLMANGNNSAEIWGSDRIKGGRRSQSIDATH
jgi:NADPH:quinone reductase-like Zn-dependent oxidoreductase